MQHMVFIMHLRCQVLAQSEWNCSYSKLPPDDEELNYSKHVEDDY